MWAGQGLWGSPVPSLAGPAVPREDPRRYLQGRSDSSPQGLPSGLADAGPGGGGGSWGASSPTPAQPPPTPLHTTASGAGTLPPSSLLPCSSAPSPELCCPAVWDLERVLPDRPVGCTGPWTALVAGGHIHACGATLSQAGLRLSPKEGTEGQAGTARPGPSHGPEIVPPPAVWAPPGCSWCLSWRVCKSPWESEHPAWVHVCKWVWTCPGSDQTQLVQKEI